MRRPGSAAAGWFAFLLLPLSLGVVLWAESVRAEGEASLLRAQAWLRELDERAAALRAMPELRLARTDRERLRALAALLRVSSDIEEAAGEERTFPWKLRVFRLMRRSASVDRMEYAGLICWSGQRQSPELRENFRQSFSRPFRKKRFRVEERRRRRRWMIICAVCVCWLILKLLSRKWRRPLCALPAEQDGILWKTHREMTGEKSRKKEMPMRCVRMRCWWRWMLPWPMNCRMWPRGRSW